MLTRCLFIILSMATASRATTECPHDDVCTCLKETFKCTCNNYQDITVSGISMYQLHHVVITGCGKVRLRNEIYSEIMSMELSNLVQLIVEQFGMRSHAKEMEKLVISDVQNMFVESDGISGISNIGTISISNVSWEKVREHSLSVKNVMNFSITDSDFQIVESQAFKVENVTNFSVTNSRFGSLGSMSFSVINSRDVSFEDCKFQSTSDSAFNMKFNKNLMFQKCSFNEFANATISAEKLNSFSFSNCTVSKLESHAFKNVNVLERIAFSYNVFSFSGNSSFIVNSNKTDHTAEDIKDNLLICGCDMSWVLDNDTGVHKEFIENNFFVRSSYDPTISSVPTKTNFPLECSNVLYVSSALSTCTVPEMTSFPPELYDNMPEMNYSPAESFSTDNEMPEPTSQPVSSITSPLKMTSVSFITACICVMSLYRQLFF